MCRGLVEKVVRRVRIARGSESLDDGGDFNQRLQQTFSRGSAGSEDATVSNGVDISEPLLRQSGKLFAKRDNTTATHRDGLMIGRGREEEVGVQ